MNQSDKQHICTNIADYSLPGHSSKYTSKSLKHWYLENEIINFPGTLVQWYLEKEGSS